MYHSGWVGCVYFDHPKITKLWVADNLPRYKLMGLDPLQSATNSHAECLRYIYACILIQTKTKLICFYYIQILCILITCSNCTSKSYLEAVPGIGDGHQPNSSVSIPHYKDFLPRFDGHSLYSHCWPWYICIFPLEPLSPRDETSRGNLEPVARESLRNKRKSIVTNRLGKGIRVT